MKNFLLSFDLKIISLGLSLTVYLLSFFKMINVATSILLLALSLAFLSISLLKEKSSK